MDIVQRIRELLKTVREVEEWRDQHDPGTPEWETLCALSSGVAGLIFSLPAEMLPPEELRVPSSGEYALIDELLSLIDEVQQGK